MPGGMARQRIKKKKSGFQKKDEMERGLINSTKARNAREKELLAPLLPPRLVQKRRVAIPRYTKLSTIVKSTKNTENDDNSEKAVVPIQPVVEKILLSVAQQRKAMKAALTRSGKTENVWKARKLPQIPADDRPADQVEVKKPVKKFKKQGSREISKF